MKENMNANQKQQPMVQVAPVSVRNPAEKISFAMEWQLKRAEDEAYRIGNLPLQSNLHSLRMALNEVVVQLSAPQPRVARYLPSRHPLRQQHS